MSRLYSVFIFDTYILSTSNTVRQERRERTAIWASATCKCNRLRAPCSEVQPEPRPPHATPQRPRPSHRPPTRHRTPPHATSARPALRRAARLRLVCAARPDGTRLQSPDCRLHYCLFLTVPLKTKRKSKKAFKPLHSARTGRESGLGRGQGDSGAEWHCRRAPFPSAAHRPLHPHRSAGPPGHVVRALRAAPAVSSVLPVPTDRMGPNRSRTGTAHISEITVRLPCCARLARPRVCVCAVAGGARAPWRVARARRRPVTGCPSTSTGTGTGDRCGRVGSSQARSRQGPRGAPSQEPRRPWSVPWSVRARARRAGEARERRAGAQIRRRSDTCGSGLSSLHAWLLSMLFPLVVRVCHV